ncbi:MAG: glutamine synthetase family protein [bacterium]|nr:glutamine synthetase family protein [bacterium]
MGQFVLPEGIHTVSMGAGDLNGILRGKRVPASRWPVVRESGIALSAAIFAIDMTCDVWDTPYCNMETGYHDCHMFPFGKVWRLPWEEGVAFCMGRVEDADHRPVPIDPRGVLLDVLERASAMGFEVKIGSELEFYLLDPETKRPRDRGIQVYNLTRAAELEHVVGPIRRHLNDVGIPVEQSNPEYAAGQVEVNIEYGEALETADRTVAFRGLVKQIAHSQGYLATFMAKPITGESGSGFHLHHSLWQDGKAVFHDEGGALSRTGLSYLAGIQMRMAETALIGSTTPNAYRRRRPESFSPVNNSWGYDNRSTGIRIIGHSPQTLRIEVRDGSADCNPYYLFASQIAAGLDGIEQGLEPTPPHVGNAYVATGYDVLPTTIDVAIVKARDSGFLLDLLGADRLEILVNQAERERDFVADVVTDIETERYLESF